MHAVVYLVLAWAVTAPSWAAGPSGLLNDTGQFQCDDGNSTLVACSHANTGNAAAYPRQDGRFGRDAATRPKLGAGAAGFDFSKICTDGSDCSAQTIGNVTANPASTDWACTKDNVTNLLWSLQSQDPVTWTVASSASYPDAGHNSASRCGFSTGWRLPTTLELTSIVHNGLASSPVVDVDYFPGTQSTWYWTSEIVVRDPSTAWIINFYDGETSANSKSVLYPVRLVRSGL